ncbi:MAG: hypothetical protein Q8P95_04190 [bacterium]|nr:hypothetical protein [bacterium]
MSKCLKSLAIMGSLLALGLFVLPHLPVDALAQGSFGVDRNIIPDEISRATGGETSFINLVRTIINYFLGFLGILAIAIVIYGGFMYVTAGVNESGAETGKKVLMYAAIGIVVILLSFVLVNLLLNAAVPGGTA